MAITLPATPGPRNITARLVSRRRDLEPTFNGPTSRVRRIGSRWSIDFDLPPMTYSDAMVWVAALTSAEADTVILAVPQPGFSVGSPGSPLVNGASQLGSTIDLDGFSTSYAAKVGQWFNVTVSSRLYLYQVATAKTASADVMNDLVINPMIRASPANNSAADFATPKIEGFLSGDQTAWTVDTARHVGLSFTITEAQ
jgi:hypothetical protein